MPRCLQRATCRAWLHLLATCTAPSGTTSRVLRPHRCSLRSLSSSAVNNQSQSTTAQPPTHATKPPATSHTLPTRHSSPPARTLTPAILSQFHGVAPPTARNLIHTILQTHSTTLTPADYGTLIHLAHSLTPQPHTLVLTLYTHYTGRHPLSLAPDELFQYVLPVLHHHDRHADVLRLYTWMSRRRLMDQVMLGVLLRACDVRQDGKLAYQLWEKYSAPQPTAEERRVEEAREQEEKAAGRAASGRLDRRREGAALARFVEESLFPHSSYHGIGRSGLSSPTSAFNLLHYTYIVSALRHHPYHANQALSVLWHMHHHGVRPDTLFYNRLLGTLTTKLLPACCLYVLRDMEANSLPIDGRVYYFVITAHAMRGRWSEVVRLIAEMRDRGLDVNEHVYEAAVVCCGETGQVQRAREIVAEMQHRAVPLTWRCYTALITMAGQAGDWEWVLQLFDIGKERTEFRKQLLANDTVIEALVRAEERGEVTAVQMTAEQVYRRYFPEVIGPRGLWLLMRRGVEAERVRGVLECTTDVRQLLTTATTPHNATYIGRMQVRQQWAAEQGRMHRPQRKYQSTADKSRQYRLFVPNTSIEEAIASLDILLLCMLYQAAHRSTVDSLSGAVDEGEGRWREHLSRLPACMDSFVVVTPKDTQPSRELSIRRQLHDDPIYAASVDQPLASETNAETVAAATEGAIEEAAEAAGVQTAADQELREGEEDAEDDEQTELETASSISESAASVDSDPAVEAVAQAEAELREKEVEPPSLGHFVVHTVNSLLSLVTKPLQRRTPGSVLEIEPADTQSTTQATAAPSSSSSSSSSSLSSTGSPTSEPSALAGLVGTSASQPANDRNSRGLTLLSTMQQHLRTVYAIDTRVTDDKAFHRLTLTSHQLTRWVEREVQHRRGRTSEQSSQQHTHNERNLRVTRRRERWSGAERVDRVASGERTEEENATKPTAQTVVT